MVWRETALIGPSVDVIKPSLIRVFVMVFAVDVCAKSSKRQPDLSVAMI